MASKIDEFYKQCRQCPRKCGVDRTASTVVECPQGRIETTANYSIGFCREPADLRIAFAGLHFGEEPLVTVFGGSGTIFFTGCTLRCAFCQNYQISQDGFGRAVDSAEFTDICLRLQAAGAENINLVSFVPHHNGFENLLHRKPCGSGGMNGIKLIFGKLVLFCAERNSCCFKNPHGVSFYHAKSMPLFPAHDNTP